MFDRYVFGVQSYLLTFGVWKPTCRVGKIVLGKQSHLMERFLLEAKFCGLIYFFRFQVNPTQRIAKEMNIR